MQNWEHGFPAETAIRNLEEALLNRERLIGAGKMPVGFDWEGDMFAARQLHLVNLDQLGWIRARYEGVVKLWSDWAKAQRAFGDEIGIEGLRSMVILNGAAVLAALAVISGQIASPGATVVLAAKVMVTFALAGLVSTAVGYAILHWVTLETEMAVTQRLVGPSRYRRLRGLSRYLRRYYRGPMKAGNVLALGAIGLFVVGAFFSLVILLSA
jgi:hypothetical protein